MIWFTSDWHLGDDRLGIEEGKPNVFFRPFSSIEEQNNTIINNCNKYVKEDDILIHLGDVCFNSDYLPLLEKINCRKKILVLGNYDEDKELLLEKYFSKIVSDYEMGTHSYNFYLDHYPLRCKNVLEINNDYNYAITGHIHGAWRFNGKCINVGVDAWNFNPISEKDILFLVNGIENHYDENVFLDRK